jgi:hypothetical protein
MMSIKAATIFAAVVAASACHAQAVVEDQINKLKPMVLNGNVSILTVGCPAGYQSEPIHVQLLCAMTLRILIDDLQQKGEFGRIICPNYAGNRFQPLFDAITDYVSEKEPSYKERAETIARIALARRFPCAAARSDHPE